MQMQAASQPIDYLPILIMIVLALGFVIVTIVASSFLGPKRKSEEKLKNFESGIKSVGNARQPMNVKYFLVAILFVLFDVEIVFFYPYAVTFKELGAPAYIAVLIFVACFMIGFYYVLRKGVLEWTS